MSAYPIEYVCIILRKYKLKENFLENIRWSELEKQNIQAKKNSNQFATSRTKQ